MAKRKVVAGLTYGHLRVLKWVAPGRVMADCGCGKSKVVWSANLLSGKTTTCGCRSGPRGFERPGIPLLQRYWAGVFGDEQRA